MYAGCAGRMFVKKIILGRRVFVLLVIKEKAELI